MFKVSGSCRLKASVDAQVTTMCLHYDHHCCFQISCLDNVNISFPLCVHAFLLLGHDEANSLMNRFYVKHFITI
jgi:hypothetical protein